MQVPDLRGTLSASVRPVKSAHRSSNVGKRTKVALKRYPGMTDVPCSVCGEPARAFRANADGSATPFCAQHIPNRESRRTTGRFRIIAAPAPEVAPREADEPSDPSKPGP